MSLNELIQQGWGAHADKTAEVADKLEAGIDLVEDAQGAAGFMNLVNHTIGDHLGDRARALRINEAAAARVGETDATPHWLQLAVSRHLADDANGAKEVEAKLGDDASVAIRVGMLVAQGRMHAGDWDAAATLYGQNLAAAEALPEGNGAERAVAVVSNNMASEVLAMDTFNEAQGALMAKAADAARTFWLRVGNWVNDERSDYLLSGVNHKLGKHEDARVHAERALQTIADNGEEKVDEAFLHLARAAACRGLGDEEAYAASIDTAKTLAAGFDNAGLTSWFEEELAKVV
ncbi:MAG: hypothetical protein QNJ98_10600 [Planctomycetota bacterium]|nr:hypothetical protein [Planctomycetota bacterium]